MELLNIEKQFDISIWIWQTCTKNSIEIHDDPNEELVDQLASSLGLRRIGWVFTDLLAEDLTKGTVKHSRGHLVSIVAALLKQYVSSAIV